MPEADPHHLDVWKVGMNHPNEFLKLVNPWQVLVCREVGPWENNAIER